VSEGTAGEAPCELLAWDSEFFGRRIGRLHGRYRGRLDRALLDDVERWRREEAIDCLYLLADGADSASAPLAEEAGFRLTDLRITLDRPLAELAVDEPAADPGDLTRIRPALPDDLPELRRIAAASHRDSRFYADPRFGRARCDELYATWIAASCRGEAAEAVLVAEVAGRPAGYITCLLRPAPGQPPYGQIGLLAVGEAAQGRGMGGRLVQAALVWFAEQGAAGVSVVTQGRNERAQRLYQRLGLYTRAVEIWFHKWY